MAIMTVATAVAKAVGTAVGTAVGMAVGTAVGTAVATAVATAVPTAVATAVVTVYDYDPRFRLTLRCHAWLLDTYDRRYERVQHISKFGISPD